MIKDDVKVNSIINEIPLSTKEKSILSQKSRLDFSIQKNIAFKFMYNGKNYEGLVTQQHTENTVEQHIFDALKKAYLIENVESANYSRCGRTDAGVSSTGNVFSIYLRYKSGLDYVKIINNILPDDIMIIGSCEVDDSFDARFSCLYREYKYFFLKNNMDIERMQAACKKLEGVHNFKNFCKIDKSNKRWETKNYERRIFEFTIEKYDKLIFPSNNSNNIDNDYFEMYYVTIKGSAFLWHQVRCMMGILFLVGKHLEDLEIIDNMFDINLNKTYNFEIANEASLVLSNCEFEGVTFNSSLENYAENFFSISRLYEQNMLQVAINSFFYRNLFNLMKPQLIKSESIRSIEDEHEVVELMEKKYRFKRKYTKLLNHKMNRTIKDKDSKKSSDKIKK
jgi:tRNA pseudouridine38/39 synthase